MGMSGVTDEIITGCDSGSGSDSDSDGSSSDSDDESMDEDVEIVSDDEDRGNSHLKPKANDKKKVYHRKSPSRPCNCSATKTLMVNPLIFGLEIALHLPTWFLIVLFIHPYSQTMFELNQY